VLVGFVLLLASRGCDKANSRAPELIIGVCTARVSMGLTMTDLKREAAECLRRALRYRSQAVATDDPILRDHLFDIEDRWLSLADSYRSAQQAVDAAVEARGLRAV